MLLWFKTSRMVLLCFAVKIHDAMPKPEFERGTHSDLMFGSQLKRAITDSEPQCVTKSQYLTSNDLAYIILLVHLRMHGS